MPGAIVDLNSWTPYTLADTPYEGSFSGHGVPNWLVSGSGSTVELGAQNSAPSVFCSDVPAPGFHMEGKMKVQADGGDNDYFGFAVGFEGGNFPNEGDFANPAAAWYLLDWKKANQGLNNGYNPCDGKSMTGYEGLLASKVTGKAVESEYWAHEDHTCPAPFEGSVEKLPLATAAKAEKSGVGWVKDQVYKFCLAVKTDYIELTIDGVEEIVIKDVVVKPNSPFCLYSFSQDDPEWSDITIEPLPPSGSCGDPHFKTWKNEHFEYHGQCDLVLAKDAKFADGLGLDVHIRTGLVRYWSYIKSAVIRIGNDILEIEGSTAEFDSETHYWLNYEYQAELTEFAGFPVKKFSQQGTAVTKNRIEIDLSSKYPGQKIVLSTYKEFVKVEFKNSSFESYGNTVGMLGDYKTGKTVGRDGTTEFHDFTDYGHEWQVLPADGKLFREAAHPQFPELCIDPEDPRGQRKRRLAESTVSMEDAEAACASLKDELDRKDCVYDIIATQDMDMVGAY
ncbi:unnamed protein product [Cylindrotheca closterium]|uniref:VWFD domain-containing protein n=1 Tax=Cylindrotheca closterium TaxID=2856 RepID=A0AAD2CNP6_9STRA|nr:unnamed protein product [Cylindrotheca closterium]